MTLVALSAILLGWVAAERHRRVAALAAEYQRAEERVLWAEQMRSHGYLSRPHLTAEQRKLQEV